jgi:hypothetical protein
VVCGVVVGWGRGYVCVSCIGDDVCGVVCNVASPRLISELRKYREKSELNEALLDMGTCVTMRAWSDRPSVMSAFVYIRIVILLLRI